MTRAVHYSDRATFLREKTPGSFFISPHADDAEAMFWFFCPCGCGDKRVLEVGNGFKPEFSPSWRWNGSLDAPELTPSVNMQGHWHGWLRGGVWSL